MHIFQNVICLQIFLYQLCAKMATITANKDDGQIDHPAGIKGAGYIESEYSLSYGVLTIIILLFIVMPILISFAYSKKMKKAPETSRPEAKKDIKIIGKISYRTDLVLGRGSNGTHVYKGKFEARKVAVKRVLTDYLTEREIKHLIDTDEHPNIVRYFCSEVDEHFTYIALELCQGNLTQYMENEKLYKNTKRNVILQQITSGLDQLHKLNIIHRDIKPENILISFPGADKLMRAKIADFGLSKQFPSNTHSLSRSTEGWSAPEMHLNNVITPAVDMFSLGCIFYYVLTGQHPFGSVQKRDINIQKGRFKLDKLYGYYLSPLITKLISHEPDKRPKCKNVLSYPYFWSLQTSKEFITDVSEYLKHTDESVLYEKELNIISDNWIDKVYKTNKEMATIIKSDKWHYKGESMKDLLRFIRNKMAHYDDFDAKTKEIFCGTKEKFFLYFLRKFPLLFIHIWIYMQVLRKDNRFYKYYSSDDYTFDGDSISYRKT